MARIAFLLGAQFEDSEFRHPFERMQEAGHEVVVVGVEAGQTLAGKNGIEHVTTDAGIDEVAPEQFDGLVIPGGFSPDRLRTDARIVALTRELVRSGRPVAAICHAGSLLIEAGVVAGRTVTSWPSIRTDLENAGAKWVDREVVEDGELITSRRPDDLAAFSETMLRHLANDASGHLPGATLASRRPEGS
jgi:protease I